MGLLIDHKKKVVAYCRYSREKAQEYSIPIQMERLHQYAEENNLDIIHIEKDEGKTGLTSERPGFQRLLHDWAMHPERTKLFEGILFFAVDRLGRFQELDEFGYHTFRCKQHGKWVWYLELGALPEKQDPMHHLMIAMKQAAAADFSAKLSDRVWHGCVRVSRDGFSAGGQPCYGLERILLNERHEFVQVLKSGEQKQVSNQRVTFRPAHDETTAVVCSIFERFVRRDDSLDAICRRLNSEHIPSPGGRHWHRPALLRILRNEAYIGTRVYNKAWQQLGSTHRRLNPRSEWVIHPDAWPAVVEPADFFVAQHRLRQIIPLLRHRGRRLICSVERRLGDELIELAQPKRPLKSDYHRPVSLPIVFSIRYEAAEDCWYFTLPESLRRHHSVIGVGLAIDQHQPIICFFRLPTVDFGLFRVLEFSASGTYCQKQRIEKEVAKEALLASF